MSFCWKVFDMQSYLTGDGTASHKVTTEGRFQLKVRKMPSLQMHFVPSSEDAELYGHLSQALPASGLKYLDLHPKTRKGWKTFFIFADSCWYERYEDMKKAKNERTYFDRKFSTRLLRSLDRKDTIRSWTGQPWTRTPSTYPRRCTYGQQHKLLAEDLRRRFPSEPSTAVQPKTRKVFRNLYQNWISFELYLFFGTPVSLRMDGYVTYRDAVFELSGVLRTHKKFAWQAHQASQSSVMSRANNSRDFLVVANNEEWARSRAEHRAILALVKVSCHLNIGQLDAGYFTQRLDIKRYPENWPNFRRCSMEKGSCWLIHFMMPLLGISTGTVPFRVELPREGHNLTSRDWNAVNLIGELILLIHIRVLTLSLPIFQNSSTEQETEIKINKTARVRVFMIKTCTKYKRKK